jgi:3D-(3,5/4)-trihydroxycyclohexane-1,2-dione acylhydrolase (decyclizing)
VETQPGVGVPGYESWWDVAVPEVSQNDAIREVRKQYVEALKRERYHLAVPKEDL